jgi:acyl-CoA dehydrogenase
VVFEAAGYSPLGPVALNCSAPDEANMHLLEAVADERQKEDWLRPLAAGEIRSCFMMTDPHRGPAPTPRCCAPPRAAMVRISSSTAPNG